MEDKGDVIGSIFRIFRHTKNAQDTKEVSWDSIPGWDYEYFREYVIALTRGRDYLPSIGEYPSRINLSESWHNLFDQMRGGSNEKWALIGYEEDQRRIVLPKVPEKGLSHSVSYDVMMAGLEKARSQAGITDMIGDVHSHPVELMDPCWIVPTEITSSGHSAFSLLDVYGFLEGILHQRPSDRNRFIMGVVQGNENILALATSESLKQVRNLFNGSYEEFAKYWYGRYGWEFLGSEPMSEGGGELAVPLRDNAPSLWNINKAIAHQYQFVLYRGFNGKPFVRDYPARNTI